MGNPLAELDILRARAQSQEVTLDIERGILFLEKVLDGFGLGLGCFGSHRSRSRGGRLRNRRCIAGILSGRRVVRRAIGIRSRVGGIVVGIITGVVAIVVIIVVVVIPIRPAAKPLATGFVTQAVSIHLWREHSRKTTRDEAVVRVSGQGTLPMTSS